MRVMMIGALLLAGAAAMPAEGQVRGLPVYNPGVASGFAIHGDVGFPSDEAGGGRTFAATGRAGFGPLGITATIGTFNPDGPLGSRAVVGGTGNLRVFGGGLVPLAITLQGGYGYYDLGTGTASSPNKEERIPVGLGIAVSIPSPAVTIKPWIAPRLDVVRSTSLGSTITDTNPAISGGIELNTITGFGLQASYDYVRAGGQGAGIFGVGLHAGLKIPGL